MYLLLSAIAAIVAAATWSAPIGDVPFAQLTLDMIFARIFSCGLAAAAICAIFKSLGKDRIWPWRWTIPYVGNLLVRTCACAAIIAFAIYWGDKKILAGVPTLIIVLTTGLLILWMLFTRELNVFSEEKRLDTTTKAKTIERSDDPKE